MASSVSGVGLLAYSDLIFVFIDIEENTRVTARYLAEMLDRQDDEGAEVGVGVASGNNSADLMTRLTRTDSDCSP